MARASKPALTATPKRRVTKTVAGDSALFTPTKRIVKAKAITKKISVSTAASKKATGKSTPKKVARAPRQAMSVLTFKAATPIAPAKAITEKKRSVSTSAKKISQSVAAIPEIPTIISAIAAAKLTPVTNAVTQSTTTIKSQLLNRPATTASRAKNSTRQFTRPRLAFAVPAVIALALLVNIMGMYLWNWHGTVSYAVASVLPLPAGMVGNETISLQQYLQDQRLLGTAISAKQEGLVPVSGDGDQIFLRQAAITLMERELARYGQGVTAEDIDTSYRQFISQYRDEATAASSIFQQYGLSTGQFRNHVLRPLVLRSKLQFAITNDASLEFTQKARAKAEEALTAAKQSDSDFKTLAGQYTQDEASINTGGDIYWFTKGRGQLDPDVEAKLYQLPTGSVYPEIITGPLGFHILYIEAKASNPDEDSTSVHLRQILIKVDVDEYLRDLLSRSDVVRYVR